MSAMAATDAVPAPFAAGPQSAPGAIGHDQRQLLIALAAAVGLHLLPLVGGLSWLALVGSSAPPGVGDPAGSKDGVNVEVIDAAEFDRKYISFGKGRDSIDSTPPPSAATPPPAPQAQPQPEAAEPQPPAEPVAALREARDSPGAPDEAREPPTPQARPTPPARATPSAPQTQLTAADIDRILAEARAELQGEVVLTSAGAAARLGEVSPYVRGVMRKLKATMPRSNGVRGAVVMGIVLGATGEVAWAGVLKSSGHPQLDRLVIERVRATRFDPPPPNAPDKERTFQVTYMYQ